MIIWEPGTSFALSALPMLVAVQNENTVETMIADKGNYTDFYDLDIMAVSRINPPNTEHLHRIELMPTAH